MEGRDEGDSLVEMEAALVRTFGWSLHEIDETDTESLMGFVKGLTEGKAGGGRQRVYADQVDWL